VVALPVAPRVGGAIILEGDLQDQGPEPIALEHPLERRARGGRRGLEPRHVPLAEDVPPLEVASARLGEVWDRALRVGELPLPPPAGVGGEEDDVLLADGLVPEELGELLLVLQVHVVYLDRLGDLRPGQARAGHDGGGLVCCISAHVSP